MSGALKLTAVPALAQIRLLACNALSVADCVKAVTQIEKITEEALPRGEVDARDWFANALRILHSIDHDEVSAFDDARWTRFRDDPVRFFLRADDDTQAYLWGIICTRQPKRHGGE